VTPSYAALFRGRMRALMIAALGATFLGSLDALMVTTALPTAAQEIGGVDLIALTVGATMVTIVVTLPFAGGVIDRYGPGVSFAVAVGLFTVANVAGGLAPDMETVAASRALLGLGAGFMFAVPLGLFAVYVPEALRPRAFGVNAAMWGVSALIGPALGALLTGTVGWRWVFWVNLPLIAVVAVAAWAALRGGSARGGRTEAPVNVVGPLLLGATVLALLVLPAAAALAAAGFLVHERRTRSPVFTHRGPAIAANVAAFAAGAAFLGGETYLPLQLQAGFGHGVEVVGAALVAATVGWTAGSMGAARFDALPRNQIAVGTALVVGGTLVMAVPLGGAILPTLGYAVAGLGMGIASPALFTTVLAEGAAGREGQSTSSIPVARQVGAGIGTALAGIVFALAVSDAAIRAAEREGAAVAAVVDGARLSFLAAALLGATGLVACRWLRDDVRAGAAVARRGGPGPSVVPGNPRSTA
jgi:MFS family permease